MILLPLIFFKTLLINSRELIKKYDIYLNFPLFVSTNLDKEIKKRIDNDMRFKKDVVLMSITTGTYKTSRSLFKFIDIFLLLFQSFISNTLILSFDFHPAIMTFSSIAFILYLVFMIQFKPHIKDMRFLFSSKLVFYLTTCTITISSSIPNAIKTDIFAYLILCEIIVCFLTTIATYFYSLIEGQKVEKVIIKENLNHIHNLSQLTSKKEIYTYLQKNKIDCTEALFDYNDNTYNVLKTKLISIENNPPIQDYYIVNPINIDNDDTELDWNKLKNKDLFHDKNINRIEFAPMLTALMKFRVYVNVIIKILYLQI
jgi:hypothetical protein